MPKFKSRIIRRKQKISHILLNPQPVIMNGEERTAMTVSCRDSDYIPKVENAGKIIQSKYGELQVMHNGIGVIRGCYHGDWMENVIKKLNGHHEPQEEKAFYEVLRRLKAGSTMIELGSFWGYYSMWFNKHIKNAHNYCFEPDPTNLKIGIKNAEINECKMSFEEAAAGSEHNKIITLPLDSNPEQTTRVKIVSVDGFVKKKKLKKIDLLHMDVQGVELDALRGAEQSIKDKRIRFVIISTHHYMFSGDPLTHDKCLDFIRAHNGHIISEHSILESYSGDGLIIASFDTADKNFEIELSYNRSSRALFRSYEKDLAKVFERNVVQ